MDYKDIAKEWFKIAEADLSSAEFLQNMQSISIEKGLGSNLIY